MTHRDIINYVTFKSNLEQLINEYIAKDLPATFIVPVIEDAYRSLVVASNKEIEDSQAETQLQNLVDENKEKEKNIKDKVE